MKRPSYLFINSVKRNKSGFTLIEVMVALAIVAISLGSAIAITSQDIMRADSMQHRTYANWIAQNKLAEYRINNIEPKVGTQDGSIIFSGNNWNWETTISKTGVVDLYRMDVAVSIASRQLPNRTITGFIHDNSKLLANDKN